MNLFRKSAPQGDRAGKLVSIESFDISERHNQASLLAQTLAENDFVVEHVQFQPPVLEQTDLNPRAAAIFFALEHFKNASQIREAQTLHDVIIVEGYVPANAAYCGAYFEDHFDRIEFFKWLDNLSFSIFDLPRPQLNIILDPVLSNSDTEVLQQSFADLAKLLPNTKYIEYEGRGEASRQNVHNKAWELVRRIVLKTNIQSQ